MGLHEIPTAFIAFSFHFLGWDSGIVEWWNGEISLLHFLQWDSTFQGEIPHSKVIFLIRWLYKIITNATLMLDMDINKHKINIERMFWNVQGEFWPNSTNLTTQL